MTRHIVAAFGAVALATVTTVGAQTPPPPRQPPAPNAQKPPQHQMANTPVSMTGCLKPWDESTMGTPPVSGTTTPAEAQFVLTDVEHDKTSDRVTTGTGMAHPTFVIKAKDGSVNLAPHVNHKIQVTGTLTMDMPATGTPPATTTPPTTTETPTPKPTVLMASAVKMISATCP